MPNNYSWNLQGLNGFENNINPTLQMTSSQQNFINSRQNPSTWQKTKAITNKALDKTGQFFNNTGQFFMNNADTISKVSDTVGNLANGINAAVGGKNPYEGPKGDLRSGIDNGWNSISDFAGNFGPYGKLVQGGMKALGALNSIQNAALRDKALDNMTTTDALLSSPLGMMVPGLGLVNALAGKNADTITKNDEAFAQVGSSFGGANNAVDEALKRSGKRYGGFSSGARKNANAEIAMARNQQSIIEELATESQTRNDLMGSMSSINGMRRAFNMQGGYSQSSIRVGKSGLKLQSLEQTRKKVEKYKNENNLYDPFNAYLFTLPKNQKNTTDFRVRDYWEFNGRPRDFNEAVSKGMFILEPDGWHAKSVAENPNTREIEFMKSSSHPSHYMEVDWYNSDDASEFRSKYELQKTEPYWKYVKREDPQKFKGGGSFSTTEILLIEETPEFREGGAIESPVTYIELVDQIEEFREGGKFNVIPEGALHARLHHMENSDNITKKGIPVVSEKEGGELEQQAEIEREEIIFRLEVTQKLEQLAKENTNESAIEAGKLLVQEILYNTIDNTNNLL